MNEKNSGPVVAALVASVVVTFMLAVCAAGLVRENKVYRTRIKSLEDKLAAAEADLAAWKQWAERISLAEQRFLGELRKMRDEAPQRILRQRIEKKRQLEK